MTDVDLKKVLSPLYDPNPAPVLVDVPPLRYLAIDGTGDPDRPEYAAAVEALYTLAYTARFTLGGFTVMPLEGLLRTVDGSVLTAETPRERWAWTMAIVQPDRLTDELFVSCAAAAAKKKPAAPVHRVRLVTLDEGRCVQALHVGPYAAERPTVERMFAFAREQGAEPTDAHHEIYLSDPRRVAPERLKTIVRHPLRCYAPGASSR
jgi:hypothetical protein